MGDSYEITHTGTVYKAEADGYIVSIFGVGSGAWPFTTAGHGADRAELFASPHPWIQLITVAQVASSRVAMYRKTPKELGGIRVRAAFVVQRVRGSRAHPPRRRIVGRLRVHGRVGGAKAHHGQNRRLAIQIGRKGHWRTVGRARLRPRGRFCRSG